MKKQSITHAEWVPTVLLTRGDLQKMLKVSSRTISRLLDSGGLPAPIRVGCSARWRVNDIIRFIEGQAGGVALTRQ